MTNHSWRQYALAISCTLTLSGCLGTATTRIEHEDRDWAGKYPFKAVWLDCQMIATMPSDAHGNGTAIVMMGLLSFPVDLVVDALLLPVDLVLWPCGFEKGGLL